ncbi:MAG TPA: twin-arginine translocase TatA/TatE family subunit [Anaerolineae bacterium]|nr:twin-arginine translocase TatA/TatE family subunit [Anaerolineae bacterium]HID84530.1 twin-arginine translocase TatA/TatE family subunit [Anaerolineales bacterium]HIQ09258.1 twin-arginine translocase TatA/TatE family subunit [Anaerolineaceae bacterium]
MNPGPTELIIILVIVLILFGVGRISRIAGELGASIRAFREGLQGTDKSEENGKQPPPGPTPPQAS